MSTRSEQAEAVLSRAVATFVAMLTFATLVPSALEAQVSGRVILREGPIGVDIVFGRRPSVVVEYGSRRYEPRHPRPGGRVVVVDDHRPAPYRRGMSLQELERYLAWIEGEYRYFRRLRPREAHDRFGWSEYDLDRYVDWLKDERKFLKRERKELRKLYRGRRGGDWDDGEWDDDDWEDDDWYDDDDWDDDDWDDDDWDDDDDDRWERDDDRPKGWPRARPGRGRGG